MKIKVNYQDLLMAGNNLSTQSQQVQQLIEKINEQMLSTSSIWQGSDNDAFVQHVQALHPQLMKMVYVIQSYADVLKTCANAYEQLQQNRLAQARAL